MRTAVVVLLTFLVCGAGVGWAQDLQVFQAEVSGQTVTYQARICDSGGATSVVWAVYYDLDTPPTPETSPDATRVVTNFSCGTQFETIVRTGVAPGLYQSYAKLDPSSASTTPEGPIEVCVGPDLKIEGFAVDNMGASITYRARVCNRGSMIARKFRVGFWHDRGAAPDADDMGDLFKAIVELAPDACEDVEGEGGLRPNGAFQAWCRVDSGDFVSECRENNTVGPRIYTLSNPDLYVKDFSARVDGRSVTYEVEVCNKGTASVSSFYVDVYYHRPKELPFIGDPGDEAKKVAGLTPNACTTVQFKPWSTGDGDYQSYCLIDADDFVGEPDEGNNLSRMLPVRVGEGGTPGQGGGDCSDVDGDQFGVGPDCPGVPDCDDGALLINPAQEEICDDGVDQDCDLTPDDGCDGVDCIDGDGDGFGVGDACKLADCNDSDKAVFPWAPEKCGDNVDDNCNGIADEGCAGRQCIDQDADGSGLGEGCPGPQDCDDTDHFTNRRAEEVCGNGLDDDCDRVPDDGCPNGVDNDGDGAQAGGRSGQPDCNDRDRTIGPKAAEVCGDGVDNDCDGTVDDGCDGVDCNDADGDGWGKGSDCLVSDCRDDDDAIHPWAEELCGDGVDNDCDGTVDDGCSGVDCVDGDGDGWGIGTACVKEDCDDEDGGVSPWAAEICADDVDNDCDRLVDENCPVCTDRDGDGHGIGPKCGSWDCDDDDETVHPGAEDPCNGVDNNCDGVVPQEGECTAEPETHGCSGCAVEGGGVGWAGWLLLLLFLASWRRARRP